MSATYTTLSSLSSPTNIARLAVYPDISPQHIQAEIGLDRDLEIFLELARGYRARAEQVGQPCPA